MADSESHVHHSRPSSPSGQRQDVPQDHEIESDDSNSPPLTPGLLPSQTAPSLSTQATSPTPAENPLEEWIKSHACWRSNPSFIRTEETPEGANIFNNSYLASIQPLVGFIFGDKVFVQHLGLMSELHERKSCAICQELYRQITLYRLDSLNQGVYDESEISCNITRSLGLPLRFDLHNIKTSVTYPVTLRWSPIGNYQYGAEVLDPKWIDVQSMTGWIRECNDDHRNCHTNSAYISPPSRLTVIDVNNKCVSEWKQGEPYLALSYVWGRTVNFELRLENLNEMLQEHSLEHVWDQIPQTIKDAILLTAKLGFRYLWVDSLCIVQDDEENKLNDINQMASIYGYASITIVAADGSDASHGLHGTGESPRRTIPQEVWDLTPDLRVVVHDFHLDTSQKVYFNRGWTFQEYELSQRLLIFANDKAMWKCGNNERQEGFLSCSEHLFLPGTGVAKDMGWPDLRSYTSLVKEYNSRATRDDSDVLAAFTGILGAINRQFPAGFFQGLPEFYFDIALLWQPRKPLRRRRAGGVHNFPSWSWTGWHGHLDIDKCWHSMEDPSADRPTAKLLEFGAETYAITRWYKTGRTASNTAPISNDYESYRRLHVGERLEDQTIETSKYSASLSQKILESGWTLSTCIYGGEGGNGVSDLESGKLVKGPCYRHPAVLEAFLYPLPIGQGPENLQDSNLSFLCFKSHRAYLMVTNKKVRERHWRYREKSCDSVCLATTAGTLAGVVRLNTISELQKPNQACELVAISRGKVKLGQGDSFTFEESRDLEQLSAMMAWRTPQSHLVDDDAECENSVCVGRYEDLEGEDNDVRGEEVDDTSEDDNIYDLEKRINIYEYYNVMWIEWENGIAYRKAVGRVYKEAWESLDLEEVDVLLG